MSSREGGRRALPPRDPVLSGEGETASPDPGTHLAVAELTPSPGPGDRLPPPGICGVGHTDPDVRGPGCAIA